MLITLIMLIIISNAVTNDKYKSIIYSRMAIQGLILTLYISYNNLFINSLDKGISLYGGMFNITAFTQGFNLFIILTVTIISLLTAFYPRIVSIISVLDIDSQKMMNKIPLSSPISYLDRSNAVKRGNKVSKHLANLKEYGEPIYYDEDVNYEEGNYKNHGVLYYQHHLKAVAHGLIKTNLREQLGQFPIIEYALITLFVLCGAIMLISTGDLISMFLSIELQSYGLYILCTLYRDSESATNSGLTYFLLGGMSSCFILFGSALLYVNTGTSNLDNIYLVSSLSEIMTLSNISSFSPISYLPTLEADGYHSLAIGKEMAEEADNISTYSTYKPYYISISLILIIVGFLFKVSAAPFHFWSPDVYDGIPTIVTTFVAIVAKISIFAFIVQLVISIDFNLQLGNISKSADVIISNNNNFNISLFSWVVNNQETNGGGWKNVLILSSLMSLTVGSVLGLTQYRIKRLFAYSTISHVGFILLALAVGKIESIQGYIFYILQYTLSNINAFFILIAIGFTLNYRIHNFISYINRYDNDVATLDGEEISNEYNLTDRNNSPIQIIRQLRGYFYMNSFVSISLAITLFSFVGIPPLIGFFAKQIVLSAALDEGFVFVTLIAVITSVIGAVYYLTIVKAMFFFPSDITNKMFFFNIETEETKGPVVESELFETVHRSKYDWNYYDIGYYHKYHNRNERSYRYDGHLSINNWMSVTISILTMIILTFIFTPNEWLRAASILSFTLFKL